MRVSRLATIGFAMLSTTAVLAAACTRQDSATGSGSDSGGTVANRPQDQNPLEANDPPKDGGKVVMAVTGETNGWNPALDQWADAGNFVGSSVLEPLLVYDAKGNYEPWLAESVQPKTPGQFDTWIIKIKPNITFHNGEKLDAAVVKKNIDQTRSDAALSAVALKGVYQDVKVVDDLSVEVDLTKPWAEYPSNLAGGSGYMMASAQIDAPSGGADHPIGTGPFVFDSWQRDQSFKAKKNPNYWQKGLPHLDEVEFRPITDSKQRIQALKAGDVNMVLTTRADDIDATKDDFNAIKDYNSEKTFVMLNTAEDPTKAINPFKNIHARKALEYATDRTAVASAISGEQELKASTTPMLAGTKWEIDEGKTGYPTYDLQKAKDEVAAYAKDTNGQPFSFKFAGLSNIEDQQIQQILVDQWKKAGIDATIDTREQTVYITQLVLGGFQAAYFRNYAYPDPDSSWVFWHSSQAKGLGVLSINFQQLKDDKIDAALDDSRSTDDVAKRQADYLTVTQAINDQAVNIWLFNTPYAVIAAKNIRGLNDLRTRGFGNFMPHPWLWANVWEQ
jgi:peptide/nickel transport system substrate-binding protein